MRCVTPQGSALLRSQLIYLSLCSRTQRYTALFLTSSVEHMPETMLRVIATSILLLAGVGFVFAIIAHVMFQHRQLPGLLASWGIGAVVTTALMMWRIQHQLVGREIAPDARGPLPLWLWYLPMWTMAFAAICWQVWRRRAAPRRPITRSALACLPLYFAALLVYFVLFAIVDARAWFLA